MIVELFDWWWLQGIYPGRFDYKCWVGIYSFSLSQYGKYDFKGWMLQTQYEYRPSTNS